MNTLGISFLADASVVLFHDKELIAALSEERLNRIKLWNGVPTEAIKSVLDMGGITLDDVDLIATHGLVPKEINWSYFEKKILSVEQSSLDEETKKIQTQVLKERYEHEKRVSYERTPGYLKKIEALGRPMKLYGHHESHAACAFYGSPWEECLVLTCDGWGEDGSASIWWCDSSGMEKIHETATIDSLGYFYGGLTEALGFKPERHEGKILGLAAYEQNPKSYKLVKEMISYDSTNKTFLGHVEGGIYLPRFNNPNLKKHISEYSREDWASAAQKRLEEVVCECVKDMGAKANRIALAGGVFANVKLNQRICELPNVNEVFVFPNMGDGGLSYGAAAMAIKENTGLRINPIQSLYLGRGYSDEEIEKKLTETNLTFKKYPTVQEKIAALLNQNHVVARFSGRMEFGPRALGARSIMYPAKDPEVNKWLNDRLNRSEFMPFAPATLDDYADQCYLNITPGRLPAQYMAMTFNCTDWMIKNSPAAVHIDGTARPQLVTKELYPDFYKILTYYHKLSGIPTLINTSFNMHEEPIVSSIEDAIRAFIDGNLPFLAIDDYIIAQEEQKSFL